MTNEEYLHQERMEKGECDAPNTGFGEQKLDLDALEALAKAATPGPWKNAAGYKIKVTATGTHCASAWERYTYEPDAEITSEKAQANASFIAAANPAVVLELIEELRTARLMAGYKGSTPDE